MGKYFSHPDKKLRDKAVAVFSKWISKQENLSDEVWLPWLLALCCGDDRHVRSCRSRADFFVAMLRLGSAGTCAALEGALLLLLDVG